MIRAQILALLLSFYVSPALGYYNCSEIFFDDSVTTVKRFFKLKIGEISPIKSGQKIFYTVNTLQGAFLSASRQKIDRKVEEVKIKNLDLEGLGGEIVTYRVQGKIRGQQLNRFLEPPNSQAQVAYFTAYGAYNKTTGEYYSLVRGVDGGFEISKSFTEPSRDQFSEIGVLEGGHQYLWSKGSFEVLTTKTFKGYKFEYLDVDGNPRGDHMIFVPGRGEVFYQGMTDNGVLIRTWDHKPDWSLL